MSWSQLRSRIQPYQRSLLLGLVLMLVGSAATLSFPWLAGKIAQGLLADQMLGLHILAPALLAVLFVQALLQVSQRRVVSATSERLAADLRADLYAHVQQLPLPFIQARRRGDFLSLLTRDIDNLSQFVTGSLLSVLPRTLTLIGSVVLMLSIDPVLTLPVVLGVPAFFVALKLFGRRIRPLAGEMRDAYARSVSVAEQNLSVLPAIKSYTRETLEADRYRAEVMQYRDLSLRLNTIEAWLGPMLQFASAAAVVAVLWLASEQVASGALLPGDLVTFLLYAAVLTRPVSGLADLWGQFQHAKGALRHMQEILEADVEALDAGQEPKPVQGYIRFEDLSFAYPARPRVLDRVNLDILAGQTVAITGENGAGKSTLVDLLLRFQTPDAGRITIDGQDISHFKLSALRNAIAVVPQQMALIDGTIEDNIRFGCPAATEPQLRRAMENADAADFVDALLHGLQTIVGERGFRLSGGQRQRVALARALLKNPAILVFDEATAMFDPAGEERFVNLARRALNGRTVLLVTHRPASLVLADRVVTLKDGRISEAPRMSLSKRA